MVGAAAAAAGMGASGRSSAAGRYRVLGWHEHRRARTCRAGDGEAEGADGYGDCCVSRWPQRIRSAAGDTARAIQGFLEGADIAVESVPPRHTAPCVIHLSLRA